MEDMVSCRGEAWRWGDELVLVVSCDDWNRRRVSEVRVVAVEEGHTDDGRNTWPAVPAGPTAVLSKVETTEGHGLYLLV